MNNDKKKDKISKIEIALRKNLKKILQPYRQEPDNFHQNLQKLQKKQYGLVLLRKFKYEQEH